ncbi:cadherin-related family member 2 [Amphiprion ocellaris]|uniref:Cadherin domain-containing protein n=1 Tax=Amphiprion ocellaris TaxID=80972 RepID=A0AAQ5YPE2_AMPOC|nr:cadherin-related family member 2 [Amphiprion ocellaris]
MGGIARNILLFCLVSFASANNSPVIEPQVYQLCEDTPIKNHAFNIIARDDENDPLTFTLTGPNAAFFSVNPSTGSVTVAQKLDREASNVIILGVTVSDGLNTTPGTVTIILQDANDNPPIFEQTSYEATYAETTAVGDLLVRVSATDADTAGAGVVSYHIDQVTPSSGFELFNISSTTGDIRLNGSLNASLTTYYRLQINATDGGGRCHFAEKNFQSSTAFVFITVLDVADLDPQFLGLPYTGSVEENAAVGTAVVQVTAIDMDTGINDVIIYSIEDATVDDLFEISSNDGIISVLSTIDREVIGDTVTLTVKATESKPNINGIYASATAKVVISIVDINDNAPLFYKCTDLADELSCETADQFIGEVDEHSLGFIPLSMMVRDLDRFSNTELILEGEYKDVFSVDPPFTMSESTVQLLVRQPQQLDFEQTQQMVLQVIAIDRDETSFRSVATVTINIRDTNDNSPTFPQDTYKLTVPEHSPNGTKVTIITANDPDTMDKGRITYRLLPDSILPFFDVNQTTGEVYVVDATRLDRETRSLYSATLEARDSDNKPGSTVLEITVTDINDQDPVINRESYLEFVEEGGNLQVTIQATDGDDPDTVNSQIVFAIKPSMYSDLFKIDPKTGVLTNTGVLDREALDPKLNGRIELIVTATDKGDPPRSSSTTVIISVEDVNDNKPEFNEMSYKFTVKEGEKGAFVGSVSAFDLDQTLDFNRISFSILNGSFGSFIIRTFAEPTGYRGDITVDPDSELDYESARTHFEMWVEAADLEQETAVVLVEVDVLDVNDERPEFTPVSPVAVKENTTITDAVGKFKALDKDGNHSLIYELVSVKCRCSGSLTPCNWFILDPTGEIRVNPEYTVDYEECDQAEVEAQVVDEYTEKGENNSQTTGKVVINIQDINDNAPVFIPTDAVFFVVSESANKGTPVGQVTATDRDSGENREITFEVAAVRFEDTNNVTTTMKTLFDVLTTQQNGIYVGIIQPTEALDMTLKGKYLVTVKATDTGGLWSAIVLEIFTIDESYKVELEFGIPVSEVEEKRAEIIRSLSAATLTAVEIVTVRETTDETSRAAGRTTVIAYFVYTNGTALTSDEVEVMLSDPKHSAALASLGLNNIGGSNIIEPEVDPWRYILLGVVGGLVIVLTVLATSLLCTRRKYRTKLKAAKAMNSASMVTSDNQKGGAVVPGTNKYTMEGANPVLNLNIDSTLVLDLDHESSDVDKVSLNSLDYSNDMTFPEMDKKSNMHIIEEEEEDNGPPEYIEPLGAALAQRNPKKDSNTPNMGYTNHAFNTTDL